MITKPRALALALAVTAVLGMSGLAFAGSGYKGGPCYGMNALSAEQQAEARKLHDEFRNSTESVRKQLIVKEAELRAEMSGRMPDARKIEELSKEIGGLRGQMLSARAGHNAKLESAGLPAPRGWKHGMDRGHRGDRRGWGGNHGGDNF